MTFEQVMNMVSDGESETLEFKKTTASSRQAVKTICAMLNRGKGVVSFCVSSDRSVIGQQVREGLI